MSLRSLTLALLLVGTTACSATYEKTALKSWDSMRSGQIDGSLATYEKDVTRSQDSLLRLMDEGMLLRSAGRFQESNEKFFKASRIIEQNGYLSLGEQGASLLTNERMTTYQGEDFEKVLIHLYLGLNFLSLNREEEALVETRKVNEILQVMMSEGKRPYEFNAFARYLGAMLFENSGDLNDALVAYRNTLKIDETLKNRFPVLPVDIIRLGLRLGFVEEVENWKKSFGEEAFKEAQKINRDREGALAVLFEAGKSPLKVSSKEHRKTTGKGGTLIEVAIPVSYYEARKTRVTSLKVSVATLEESSAVLTNIEQTAIQHLQDRMGRVIAKALLTAATKAAVATGVGAATNSKELGFLTGIALMLMSEADTRSWLLLPGSLQVAKIFLKPGDYSVSLQMLDRYGNSVGAPQESKVSIKSHKTTFLQKRAFD